MAKTKILSFNSTKSPAMAAGLFFIFFLLTGCQTGKSPEEVTRLFWTALAQGKLEEAKSLSTRQSLHLVELKDIDKLSTITTGTAEEDENDDARVPTTIMRNQQQIAFDTVLQQENNVWKVDYLRTQLNMTLSPLGDMAKTLGELGGAVTKQLEEQMPLIQKQLESFGLELKKQMEEFSRALKIPPKQNNSSNGGRSI